MVLSLEPRGLMRDNFPMEAWKIASLGCYTCNDTSTRSYLNQTLKAIEAAANKAENKMTELYKSIVLNQNFVAFSVETLGHF